MQVRHQDTVGPDRLITFMLAARWDVPQQQGWRAKATIQYATVIEQLPPFLLDLAIISAPLDYAVLPPFQRVRFSCHPMQRLCMSYSE